MILVEKTFLHQKNLATLQVFMVRRVLVFLKILRSEKVTHHIILRTVNTWGEIVL